MTAAKPILDVRRAFNGFFSASSIVVPGTTPPTSASAAGPSVSVAGRLGVVNKPNATSAGKGKGKAGDNKRSISASTTSDSPGAKAKLATYLDGGKLLFLAGWVFDVEAIAKNYKVKRTDYRWPVLLSSKPGALALSLCPDPAKHGDLKDAAHRCPPQFSRSTASAAPFVKPATPAQCLEVGWEPDKRGIRRAAGGSRGRLSGRLQSSSQPCHRALTGA
jgi:hypothetical protein